MAGNSSPSPSQPPCPSGGGGVPSLLTGPVAALVQRNHLAGSPSESPHTSPSCFWEPWTTLLERPGGQERLWHPRTGRGPLCHCRASRWLWTQLHLAANPREHTHNQQKSHLVNPRNWEREKWLLLLQTANVRGGRYIERDHQNTAQAETEGTLTDGRFLAPVQPAHWLGPWLCPSLVF